MGLGVAFALRLTRWEWNGDLVNRRLKWIIEWATDKSAKEVEEHSKQWVRGKVLTHIEDRFFPKTDQTATDPDMPGLTAMTWYYLEFGASHPEAFSILERRRLARSKSKQLDMSRALLAIIVEVVKVFEEGERETLRLRNT